MHKDVCIKSLFNLVSSWLHWQLIVYAINSNGLNNLVYDYRCLCYHQDLASELKGGNVHYYPEFNFKHLYLSERTLKIDNCCENSFMVQVSLPQYHVWHCIWFWHYITQFTAVFIMLKIHILVFCVITLNGLVGVYQ